MYTTFLSCFRVKFDNRPGQPRARAVGLPGRQPHDLDPEVLECLHDPYQLTD